MRDNQFCTPVLYYDNRFSTSVLPRFQITGKFPHLVSYTTLDSGGHFNAMEVPDLLSADIFNFVSKVEAQKENTK